MAGSEISKRPSLPKSRQVYIALRERIARGVYDQNGGLPGEQTLAAEMGVSRVTLRREMLIYPSIDPQPGFEDLLAAISGEIETHYRGLGRDFYRIRPYEAFESARHVDWKATAHTRELQVREFAREQEQTVELFLDRDLPPAHDAWFEHAVDCCAFLAWRLATQGAGIHFRAQGGDQGRLPR